MDESRRHDFFDPGAASRLLAQMLVPRHPMEGTMSGHHRSLHRGSSVEFAEFRNYVPGDDLRRLDWRVFGKTDRFFVKEFEAETNLRCYFVVDCSGSMGFPEGGPSKLDFARRVVATLAYLVIRQGDAAGLQCVGETTVQEIPASRNPSHLQVVFQLLAATSAAGPTGLVQVLHKLAERVRRRSLVVIVSDLFAEADGLRSCFQHLRHRHHDVAVLQVLDRREVEFRVDRPTRFLDLESSGSVFTDPNMIREDYLRAMESHLQHLELGCREFGIDYRRMLTDEDYEQVLARFLADRTGKKRMGR